MLKKLLGHNASFPLDYEVVFGKAHAADYWRIVGSYGDTPTYEGLLEENGLYQHFKAFKEQHIIYCNARESGYFETSPLEPHLILADFIKAFHPYPQLIQAVFNLQWFEPSRNFTCASLWPWIDHLVSGLLNATKSPY